VVGFRVLKDRGCGEVCRIIAYQGVLLGQLMDGTLQLPSTLQIFGRSLRATMGIATFNGELEQAFGFPQFS
jgi:hypothetical protein